MSFGWSPSDIVSLARLSYEIYRFCQNAPAELRSLFDRLDNIGRKLEQLSTILEKSGLGTWRLAPALEQHLLDARAYLDPLQPVTNKTASSPSKAKGLARLALSKNKLKRIEKDLDTDERSIDDLKIDLILVCSLRNLRNGSDVQPHISNLGSASRAQDGHTPMRNEIIPVPDVSQNLPLSLEAECSDTAAMTVSNASNALVMAMGLRSQPSWNAAATVGLMPEGGPRSVQTTNDFITDIASLAEETELYSKDIDPERSLERLTEFTEKATSFRLALRPLSISSNVSATNLQLPALTAMNVESFGYEVFDHLYSTSDNASTRMWVSDYSQMGQKGLSPSSMIENATPPTSCSDHASSSQIPSQTHTGDEDAIFQLDISSMFDTNLPSDNNSFPKYSIDLQGRSKVSLIMDPRASMDCSFDLSVYDSSVVFRVALNNEARVPSDAMLMSRALSSTSNPSPIISQSTGRAITNIPSRAFQHCVQYHTRPIPHLLHPDVEGPIEEPEAPYAVTFTEPQYIFAEGASEGPRWTSSLMYIFYEKQDRTTLCEKIFGKTMIISGGTNKIAYNGREVSHVSAISLWFDSRTATYSITFSPNLTAKTTSPKDIELKVNGLMDGTKALRSPSSLALVCESIVRVDEGVEVFEGSDRQPSNKSGNTFGSISSSGSLHGWEKSGKVKCTIVFTRLDDKESFTNHLRQQIPD